MTLDMHHPAALRLGFAIAALLLPLTSFAALGGDQASIVGDQAHLKASIRTTRSAAYTVHEMQAPTGTAVREYVSPAGKVFAVAWQGPFVPDMKQLLGAYFDQFARAARAPRKGHGPLFISQPGLVVESAGHMRHFIGRAYIPEMIPADARLESIR